KNPFRFAAAEMWRDFTPVAGLPGGIGVSSLEMHLVHCVVHHAWSHRLAGAGWRSFRDITAIVADSAFSWKCFLEIVEETGTGAPAYWSLALSRRLVDAEIPASVLAALRPRLRTGSLRWME